MDEVILRRFEETDIAKIKEWYTDKKEWMLWDAPWEVVEFDEDSQIQHRLERTNHKPCFEYR